MLTLDVDAADLGRMRDDLRAEQRRVEGALTLARRATAQTLKGRLRAQVSGTALGQRVANTWRSTSYNDQGVDGSAFAWSKAPAIIAGWDKAGLIRSQKGRFMAIPTGYNQKSGHRGRGGKGKTLVTPAQMVAADKGRTFLLPITGGYLWCVKVARVQTRSEKTGLVRDLAVAGDFSTRARTGRLQQLVLGSGRAGRTRAILQRGYVPMFLLLRFVRSPRLLDVRRVAETGPDILIDALGQRLAGS